MLEKEELEYLFNYIVRNQLADRLLPKDGDRIKSGEEYFRVDWSGVTLSILYRTLIKDDMITPTILQDDETATKFIEQVLLNFKNNLVVHDLTIPVADKITLGELGNWKYLRNK